MTDTISLLGSEAEYLLEHKCTGLPKEMVQLPGPDFVSRVIGVSDRGPGTMRAMQQIFNAGRLGGTGYMSMLPVDQGIEHSAGASFAPNPIYFDPANIVELAIERWLQLRRLHTRCSRVGVAALCPSDSVHGEAES